VSQSWERQPGESSRAFRAFVIFRDLGSKRSVRKVWEQLCLEKELGEPNVNGLLPAGIVVLEGQEPIVGQSEKKKIADTVKSFSIKWRWADRSRDWDSYVNRRFEERYIGTREKLQEKHIRAAAAADAINMIPMAELLKRINTPEGRKKLGDLELADLLPRALDSASRLKGIQDMERRAHGVIEKQSSEDPTFYRWELIEYQPPRPPDTLKEEKMASRDDNPLRFPDEGDDPLNET